MNYVYDILVNFKYPLLDFYEWNKNDFIENIKKIPLYKISSNDLKKMKYYKFKIDNIDDIKNNTKLFNNKKKLYNAFICTDGKEAKAFNFNDEGICIGKTSILIEEENEILDSSNLLKETNIGYNIISKDKVSRMTRREEDITKYLIKEISKIDNLDKINYICYEYLGKSNMDKESLNKLIRSNWDDRYYKIYEFLTLISMNKR